MRLAAVLILVAFKTTFVFAQDKQQVNTANYQTMHWRYVATELPDQWYGSDDAKRVAENVLLAQKDVGGWSKNIPYHHELSQSEREGFINGKAEVGATFDNGSTITELRFLAKVYTYIKDTRYQEAFEKGLHYIFVSQYENGGWPQFFPVQRDGDYYSRHITYNDDAMVNILKFLKEIYADQKAFLPLGVDDAVKQNAKISFDKGIACILKTQIVVEGKPTVWCAQHDEKTFAPAKARTYELPSFSGAESASIVLLLMDIESPSKEIVASIEAAVKWFKEHTVEGIRITTVTNDDGKRDRIVVEDKDAPAVWGRFYDLETERPFFCDRDGIKKNTLAEIGYERRNGYAWYTDKPQAVLNAYTEWKSKLVVK